MQHLRSVQIGLDLLRKQSVVGSVSRWSCPAAPAPAEDFRGFGSWEHLQGAGDPREGVPNMSNARKTAATSKSATVRKMLRRASGATLAEITTVTTWQPHSARAFLSGIRKKGESLQRDTRRDGTTCYKLIETQQPPQAGETAPSLQIAAPNAAAKGAASMGGDTSPTTAS